MGTLDNKVAVITGAASGIGRATAIRMAQEGARVALADINAEGLKEVEASITGSGGVALTQLTDVSEESEVAALVERTVAEFGGLHILHNNAAALGPASLGLDGNLESMTVDKWDRTFAVNLRSQMLCAKYSVPHMVAGGNGSVVNMSSNAGLAGDRVRLAYSASKAAVNSLTRSIATMYGKQGVRCNAVAPGFVLTPPARLQVPEQVLAVYRGNLLVPDLGEPEDIAEMVVFLASDLARYVTGQVIQVDGGSMSHLATLAPES